MQHQRIPDEQQRPRLSETEIDNTVVSFLLCGESWPWSVEEIARELGDCSDVDDALARLAGAGLIRRLGSLVFPSLALRRANQLRVGTA